MGKYLGIPQGKYNHSGQQREMTTYDPVTCYYDMHKGFLSAHGRSKCLCPHENVDCEVDVICLVM